MARDNLSATVKATIGGTEYKLRLTIGDIEAIEEELGTGLLGMLRRWQAGDHRVRELRVVLETALRSAGGKFSTDDVRALMGFENLPEVIEAVSSALFAGMDLGPTKADEKA